MRTLTRFSLALAFPLIAEPAAAQIYVANIGGSAPRRVDALFAKYDSEQAPGCAVAVIQAGRLTYAKGYGMADLEQGIRISPSSAFYLASTSKQFTAFSILLLQRDGKLALDDDVRRYVPELPDFGAPITIRQLLHHTSGLRDYFGLFALRGWQFDEPLTERDVLALLARQRALNFPPGKRHLYSNTGYVLLGLVVKRASGLSLRDFAARRIFAPLGMALSQFRDDHRQIVRRRAAAYELTANGFERSEPSFDVVGDGGLFSTVEDLARWDGNFYEPRAGDPATVARMLDRGVLATGDTVYYANGIEFGSYRGVETLSHAGAYAGYRSELLRFPSYSLTVAVLCNRGDANPTALAERVADVYLEAALPTETPARVAAVSNRPPVDGRALRRFAGMYWNDADESILRIAVDNGTLRVSGSDPLVPLAPLVFGVEGTQTLYHFDTTGARPGVVVSRFGLPDERFVAVDSASVDSSQVRRMVGKYRSDEIGVQMTVLLANGRPSVHWTGALETPLTALFGHTFLADGGLIVRFAPDDSSLTVSNGRTQRLAFKRR